MIRFSIVVMTRFSSVVMIRFSIIVMTRFSSVVMIRLSTVIMTRFSSVVMIRFRCWHQGNLAERIMHYNLHGGLTRDLLRPVLLAGRDREQRGFRGRRDLDYSVPRVQWLRTPLCGKAEAQGTRLSKPEKKGTRPIGNSRGIAVRVGRLLVGFRQGIGHLPVSVT